MQIRKAVFSDWPHLLEWRNDELTRKNAKTDAFVTEAEHKIWLDKVLAQSSFRLYIAENNNIPVGTIRSEFDSKTNTSKVSWTIAPSCRNQGFGKRMIEKHLSNSAENIHIEIKVHDLFSQKIAKSLRLNFCKQVKDILHYSRSSFSEKKVSKDNVNVILFLGYADSPLIDFLISCGEKVIHTSDRISVDFLEANNIGFIVSYGYKHIIKKEVLAHLPNRVINLHISYLPWNRGADPNFWSIVEGSPGGVTIHQVDVGLDTGNILLQQKVNFNQTDTLRSSYNKLQLKIQQLFKDNWQQLKMGQINSKPQTGKGSYHRQKDKQPLLENFEHEWLDMSIGELRAKLVVRN